MSETVDALLYDMLAWLARDARPYAGCDGRLANIVPAIDRVGGK